MRVKRTQNQAVKWVNGTIGQHLDFDKLYGQQCTDYFNYYYQYLTGRSPYSDGYSVPGAKDIFAVPNPRFTKILDSPKLKPQPGDIMIYGSKWGGGYGHVEIVQSSNSRGAYLVGENQHGNPREGVIRVYRTWGQMGGLTGVLRPNWAIIPLPRITATTAQVIKAYQDILNRKYDTGGLKNYTTNGMTIAEVIKDMMGSDEYKRLKKQKPPQTPPQDPPKAPSKPPVPTPVPTPTPVPDYAKENNGLLKSILALLQGLVDKVNKIFK